MSLPARGLDGQDARAERVPALDALRGVMALAVAVYHFAMWTRIFKAGTHENTLVAALGLYSVQGFFIISGFCFFHLYGARSFSTRGLGAFHIRRFFRIAPLYYAILLLNFVTGRAVGATGMWSRILENLSLSFGLIHPNHSMVVGGWSIGVEYVFYLFFPLLSWVFRSRVAFAAITLLSIGLAVDMSVHVRSLPDADKFNAYVHVLNHAFLFLLGGLIVALRALTTRRIQRGTLAAALSGLLVCVWLSEPVYDHFALVLGLARVVGVSACVLAVAGCAFTAAPSPSALLARPFRRLGELSYAVYLLHPLSWALVSRLPGARDAPLRSFVLGLLLTLLLAGIAHYVLEKPAMDLGRKLADQKVKSTLAHPGLTA